MRELFVEGLLRKLV